MPAPYCARSFTPRSTWRRIFRPRLSPSGCIISRRMRTTLRRATSAIISTLPRPSFRALTSASCTNLARTNFLGDQDVCFYGFWKEKPGFYEVDVPRLKQVQGDVLAEMLRLVIAFYEVAPKGPVAAQNYLDRLEKMRKD